MAQFKMLAYRMIMGAAWTAVGMAAVGGAYAANDAAYALGGFVGAG